MSAKVRHFSEVTKCLEDFWQDAKNHRTYLCYLFISTDWNTMLKKVFWSKTNFVVPINGKRVKPESLEVLNILKFFADAFLRQWNEIAQPLHAVVKLQQQCKVFNILSINDFENYCCIHDN